MGADIARCTDSSIRRPAPEPVCAPQCGPCGNYACRPPTNCREPSPLRAPRQAKRLAPTSSLGSSPRLLLPAANRSTSQNNRSTLKSYHSLQNTLLFGTRMLPFPMFRLRSTPCPRPTRAFVRPTPVLFFPQSRITGHQLLTPLESALPKIAPITRLEYALTKKGRGGGSFIVNQES